MGSIETDCRFQQAVLWESSSVNNDYGRPIVSSTPVELDVRWEETRDQVTDSQGNTFDITAKVVVAQDVEEQSILWLGALDDLPDAPTGLQQVVGIEKIPDIKNRHYRRVLLLKRAGDSLSAYQS